MNLPVWMYWEGERPAWIEACMATVYAHAPDVRLITPADFDTMWDVDRDIDLTRLSANHRSDFIRAFLLARYGGLWIDTDCVVIRSLQTILDMLTEYDFLGYNERQGNIASNFIGARQGSRIAAAYYQRNCDILRSGQRLEWLSLASFAIGDAIQELGIPWMRLDRDLVQPICWSEPEAFFTTCNHQGHAQVFNQRSFCYMLANTMIRRFQAANPTQDLMSPGTFFSYLLDRAKDDSQPTNKPRISSADVHQGPSGRGQMQHPISYLICSNQRTGSNLLCDALARTGIAGRPRECFHPALLAHLAEQTDPAAYAAFFKQVVEEGTTPNGVFGAKIQWPLLQDLVLKLRQVPEYGGIGAVELLQSWLPNLRYIRLTRRDKLRQAVSCRKAGQTGVWWEMDTWVRPDETAPAVQPMFDFDSIDWMVGEIRVQEAIWQLFFETCGVQPLDIVYEDLVEDHAATTLRVLEYLQIPVPDDLSIAQPRYRKQADDISEQWVQRYHELKAAQGAESHDAAPIAVPQVRQEYSFRKVQLALPQLDRR